MGATTSNSTLTYRCTKVNLPEMPGLTRTANGGNATVAVTAVTHAPHIPGAMRIAVRDAGCRLARSPNGGTLQSDHMARQLARIGRYARSSASSKKSTASRWNGLHSGCRCAVLPCMLPLRQPSQGAESPIPIPIPIPDLPGIGDGGPIPDLPGTGDHPRSPSPICRGSGVHPHPHPRFAEIWDTAEYH